MKLMSAMLKTMISAASLSMPLLIVAPKLTRSPSSMASMWRSTSNARVPRMQQSGFGMVLAFPAPTPAAARHASFVSIRTAFGSAHPAPHWEMVRQAAPALMLPTSLC